jgi:hypothetical protein
MKQDPSSCLLRVWSESFSCKVVPLCSFILPHQLQPFIIKLGFWTIMYKKLTCTAGQAFGKNLYKFSKPHSLNFVTILPWRLTPILWKIYSTSVLRIRRDIVCQLNARKVDIWHVFLTQQKINILTSVVCNSKILHHAPTEFLKIVFCSYETMKTRFRY